MLRRLRGRAPIAASLPFSLGGARWLAVRPTARCARSLRVQWASLLALTAEPSSEASRSSRSPPSARAPSPCTAERAVPGWPRGVSGAVLTATPWCTAAATEATSAADKSRLQPVSEWRSHLNRAARPPPPRRGKPSSQASAIVRVSLTGRCGQWDGGVGLGLVAHAPCVSGRRARLCRAVRERLLGSSARPPTHHSISCGQSPTSLSHGRRQAAAAKSQTAPAASHSWALSSSFPAARAVAGGASRRCAATAEAACGTRSLPQRR